MRKKIILKNREITYALKKSRRARVMRLTISQDANLSATIPWFGSERQLEEFLYSKADWILSKIQYFKKQPRAALLLGGNRREYGEYKQTALNLVKERLNFFNKHYGFVYGRVSIKNQKTRWGSCSKKGNLNFNYKIALAPPEFADYLVVHELCHLKELNHSKNFWALVAQTIPDYKRIRKLAQH